MNANFGDTLYARAFPALVVMCAFAGVFAFAAENLSGSLNCFIAAFFGIRLDNYIELRREAEAEAAAAAGWARIRGPARLI